MVTHRKNTKTIEHIIKLAKKKYTPKRMEVNICAVNLATKKFQNQLLPAAKAWPKVLTCCGNISELYTQGVPFQLGV